MKFKFRLTFILADKQFWKTAEVDLLIGAEIYGQLMRQEKISIKNDQLTLLDTKRGWIIMGKITGPNYASFL